MRLSRGLVVDRDRLLLGQDPVELFDDLVITGEDFVLPVHQIGLSG